MKIILGADPWGVLLKDATIKHLNERNIETVDLGGFADDPKDYFDLARKVAVAIQKGEADRGILFCGTGMGMAIVANKFKGIYAAVIESEHAAFKAKQINNANVLTMGGMFMSEYKALMAVDAWLDVGHTEGMDDELASFLKNSLNEIAKIEDENFR